jgi:hypothetical protein
MPYGGNTASCGTKAAPLVRFPRGGRAGLSYVRRYAVALGFRALYSARACATGEAHDPDIQRLTDRVHAYLRLKTRPATARPDKGAPTLPSPEDGQGYWAPHLAGASPPEVPQSALT